MATSTFGKKFVVRKSNANSFVEEMTKAVTPTLPKGFRSKTVNLAQEKRLQAILEKVLK